MSWDSALDAAMESSMDRQQRLQDKEDELLATSHDPLNWFNFLEAMYERGFNKAEGEKFEALLRAKDIKALDMLIELSTQHQKHFIEQLLEDEE